MSKHVVVGSGISGLLACLFLVNKGNSDVLLIEQGKELGGALKAFDYGPHGKFDHGMHNILLTGIPKIDGLLLPFLSNDVWAPLTGNMRDLAGIFWQGSIQFETPYPQLFRLSDHEVVLGLKDLLPRLATSDFHYLSAAEYFEKKFGKGLADCIFIPIVEKIFKAKAHDLHYTAASIVPLSRISLEDNEFNKIILQNSYLRSTLAFPQQRNLPLSFSSGPTAYYPKKYGMYRLVDSISEYLTSKGCEILTSSKVINVSPSENKVKTVTVQKGNQQSNIEVEVLVWSAGQPPLLRALNQNLILPFQRAQKTYLANLILKHMPKMGDLYYIYVYDSEYSTFRITNYRNYCEDCERSGGYPVAVEILSNSELSSEQVIELALFELTKMALIEKEDFIWGQGEQLLEGGFPLPSLVNVSSLDEIRKKISSLGLVNLVNIGIQSSPNTFFQTDVIIDTFAKLEAKWT